MNKSEFLNKINEIEETTRFKTLLLNNFVLKNGVDGPELSNGTKTYKVENYFQFLQRVGLGCSTLTNPKFSEPKRFEIEQFINTVLSSAIDFYSKVYVRDDQLLALHSKDYKILEISELVKTLENEISKKYEKFEFLNGFYSDEFTIVDYEILDRKTLKKYNEALLDRSNADSKIVVRLVTSNLGLSGANLYPYFLFRTDPTANYRMFPVTGKKIVLEHKGTADMDKFAHNCKELFPLVELLPENLEKLKQVRIENPVATILNLADKVQIPVKYVADIAEDVNFLYQNESANADEIYKFFAQVVDFVSSDVEKMQLSEKVGKAINILLENRKSVDIPVTKWKRITFVSSIDQEAMDQMAFGEVA